MDSGARAVLVVEDDPMTLGLLAQTLAQAGFTVGAAATAAQAREMWERMAPEAVVLDIDLGPGASGFDLADAFLAQSPSLAVLFLSALLDARFAGRDRSPRRQLPGHRGPRVHPRSRAAREPLTTRPRNSSPRHTVA
jgi:DNA-binding LytR/AlgR family response regulator